MDCPSAFGLRTVLGVGVDILILPSKKRRIDTVHVQPFIQYSQYMSYDSYYTASSAVEYVAHIRLARKPVSNRGFTGY